MSRRLKDLTLKDNFMFGAVMAQEANCRALLERITEIPIGKVKVLREKSIVYHPEYKGFRLDLYARDEANTRCLEDQTLGMREGCHCIFLNTLGKRPELVSEQLIRFLEYVHADLTDSEGDFQDSFVKQLQNTVREIKKSREMEERYMIFEEMLRDERAEGRAEGKAEALLDILAERGAVPDSLEKEIRSQQDLSLLRSWILLAARVNSVEEFTQKIHR